LNIGALARATSVFVSTLARGGTTRGGTKQEPALLDAPPLKAPAVESRTSRTPAAVSGVLLSDRVQAGVENKCPVCQARFRAARQCSRCGADLEPLMRLTVRSWQFREAARQALAAGDMARAMQLAVEAQAVQYTENGRALWLVANAAPRL
jgi:hypothetical protein